MTAPTAYYMTQSKILALQKETTRGTEIYSSLVYVPVDPSTEFDYKLNLIPDTNLRGIREEFQPVSGTKDGTGTIKVDAYPTTTPHFLYSLLGSLSTANPSTGVYLHTFTHANTSTQLQSYSFHYARGLSTKVYTLGCVKSITFEQGTDSKLTLTIPVLFKTEGTSSGTLSATWVAPVPFMFYQLVNTLGGSANTDISNLSIVVDNGNKPNRLLTASQDIYDVIAVDKPSITGSFTIRFSAETERVKFLANTASSLTSVWTGAQITGAYYTSLTITLPEIHYTAYPFVDSDGILSANVTFKGVYNISGSSSITIAVQNATTSY